MDDEGKIKAVRDRVVQVLESQQDGVLTDVAPIDDSEIGFQLDGELFILTLEAA